MKRHLHAFSKCLIVHGWNGYARFAASHTSGTKDTHKPSGNGAGIAVGVANRLELIGILSEATIRASEPRNQSNANSVQLFLSRCTSTIATGNMFVASIISIFGGKKRRGDLSPNYARYVAEQAKSVLTTIMRQASSGVGYALIAIQHSASFGMMPNF